MRNKNFRGVAVYPERIPQKEIPLVGVWLPGSISYKQQRQLLSLEKITQGRVLVGTNPIGNTSVKFLGRHIKSPAMARRVTMKMVQAVATVTGMRSILRQLPNHRAVSRALAS